MRVLKYINLLVLLLVTNLAFCQDDVSRLPYRTQVYSDDIKTLRVFIKGNELSYPVMELNGDNSIMVEFDLLSDEATNYSYTIKHCDDNWYESNIFLDMFTDGFEENTIDNYRFSENTLVKFVNYKIVFPNEDVNLKLSGNYVVIIFESDKKENIVATACFSVYEPLVNVVAEVTRPIDIDNANSGQELRFTVQHNNFPINDPFSEISVRILQNNNPNAVLTDIKPVFVRNNELVYNFEGQNTFKAGNEFRMFSTTDLKLLGNNIYSVNYADSLYVFQFHADERRSYKKYFWHEDTNGRYVIFANNRQYQSVEADYTLNKFYLKCEHPILDSKLYVTGEFCNWNTLSENELFYNFNEKAYMRSILMKQGVYSYEYVCQNIYTNKLDETIIDGSHYQTENNYLIFIYYKQLTDNYNRLIGFQVVNSRK